MSPSVPPPGPLSLVLVEDLEDDARLLILKLERAGTEIRSWRRIETREALASVLGGDELPDAIVSDYNVPGFGALDALEAVTASGLDIPFVVVSAHIGEERAVELLKRGAHDFVSKANLARLAPALTREVAEARMRRDRREAAEALDAARASLDRSERLRTLGLMAAGIAHDLKNVLSPLAMHLQLIASSDADAETRANSVASMRRAVSRGAELIDGLRRFSMGAPEPSRTVDVTSEIDVALGLLAPRFAGSGIRLVRELTPGLTIEGSAPELVAALLNLVTNALDALSGGTIVVRTESTDDEVTIEVRDDGPGMSEEAIERARQPFFTTKPEGTGLGLAMVRGFALRSGGRFELASTLGEGTSARIVLPRRAGSEETDR
ncbi:MAG: sensor histidine kinase [Sandaracinaceae bacterium]